MWVGKGPKRRGQRGGQKPGKVGAVETKLRWSLKKDMVVRRVSLKISVCRGSDPKSVL